jgi:hypothetical protein
LNGENEAKRGRDEGSEDEDAHVYKLIRGAPTVMFTQGGGDGGDYRPKWNNDLEDSSDTEEEGPVNTSQRVWKHRNVCFSVTLMMSRKDAGGDDYVPKENDDDSDEDGVPVSAPGAESSSSTPSPPSLEHFRGGFKLPKGSKERVPKKMKNDDSNDDCVVQDKNRHKVAVLTGGTYPNRNPMAVPEQSRVHTARTPSSSNPSVPILRGESRSYKAAKRERPSDRNKARLIKQIIAKSSLEGYPPLPETIEEFRRDNNLYAYHPMWDAYLPKNTSNG